NDDFGKACYQATTAKIARVVHDRFETEDALAFGVRLERQVAEMQLEHSQVVLRCLEHNRRLRWGSPSVPVVWAFPCTEQPPQLLDVQSRARAIRHALKDVFHLTTRAE